MMVISFKKVIAHLIFNCPLLPSPQNNLARKWPMTKKFLATPLRHMPVFLGAGVPALSPLMERLFLESIHTNTITTNTNTNQCQYCTSIVTSLDAIATTLRVRVRERVLLNCSNTKIPVYTQKHL
jgi:hypothetical protein